MACNNPPLKSEEYYERKREEKQMIEDINYMKTKLSYHSIFEKFKRIFKK